MGITDDDRLVLTQIAAKEFYQGKDIYCRACGRVVRKRSRSTLCSVCYDRDEIPSSITTLNTPQEMLDRWERERPLGTLAHVTSIKSGLV